ncbi:MAG: ABC transporter permease [Lachnospiraceae bacterium]|uniref:ABC transporter permease n=1 Tax=Candidatus Enterocloster excrementigallinarum TaxID=2838558 RepID=A0A9D2PVL8_9FIRM|nr:ABC transporter permease [Lachnospiraceae bacterium]HJC66557.1 ABC transporter permease [Candidatus Enterocloster excrementigallinarum]
MLKYILKRLGAGLVSIFVLVTITFFLMHAIPGGPFSPAEERNVPQKVLDQIADKYGLNDPVPVQYVKYLNNLLHGDLGTSFKRQDTTVNELIANGFPVSASVGIWGVALALAVGIPLGMVAAVKRGKLPDAFSMVFATIGVSVPSFVVCVLMMYLFCEKWKIFPSYGLTSWRHYVLPVFCMAFSQIAYITRLMRSSMLETMRQDYIRTERSKGVPEFQVIGKYALKNSILPVVTYVGPMVAALLTGTFIIEKLFSIPGLGRYFVSAISDRDYSVTLGLTIFVGTMIVICNLIVDILYAVIDPRVKITK